MLFDIDLVKAERTRERRRIGRYSMYKMVYRSSLEDHVQQLQLMAKAVLPFLKDYCLNETLVLAYIDCHDDPEIDPRLGDVQAAYKAVMTLQEREGLEELEKAATFYATSRFGTIRYGEYPYDHVLRNYQRRFSPEAQLVHFLDKIAAFCEAWHEIGAGNTELIADRSDPHGRPVQNPFVGYPALTEQLVRAQPFLQELRDRNDVFLKPAPVTNYATVAQLGKPHTLESVLTESSQRTVYGAWLKVILESQNQKLIEHLYTPNTFQFPNCRP